MNSQVPLLEDSSAWKSGYLGVDQHPSNMQYASKGRICSNGFMYCPTEIEVAEKRLLVA